ncbi:MAG TPA: hypothetical protein VK978_00120 [Candidatus Saccharimonadales bacterium]|nr:hypothetical protein [Candidatus Saccharimonadales bacterium]
MKTKKQPQSAGNRISRFAFGAFGGLVLGMVVLASLERGAVIALVGLMVIAAYVFILTHPHFGANRGLFTKSGSPALILGVLVIGTVSMAGAYLLNASFASRSEGMTPYPASAETNKPEYWGATCTKTEFGGNVMSYSAPENATRVIAKGGTWYVVYDKPPFEDLSAPINTSNGKPYAISHVIVCTGSLIPTPTPSPTPSTPTPPATSVSTPTPPTPTPPSPTPSNSVTPLPKPSTPPSSPTPPPVSVATPPAPVPAPAPTPPGTAPVTPSATESSTPGQFATTAPVVSRLPNVGPGSIALLVAFALIGGYIVHSLYWHIKDSGRGKKPAR